MTYSINYDMLPYQADFDASEKFYDCLFAGYGGGKTYALVMKLLKLAAINRGLPGGVLVPTIKMFKRDVLPTFREICDNAQIEMRYHSGDGVIHIPVLRALMYVFHAEDDGLSIRGPNLAYGGVNEATLVSEMAFKAFMARIRLASAKLMQVAMSGTPEGLNWTYEMFVAEPRADADVFYGDMRLNSFIAKSYAAQLEGSYDDIMVQQYVGGKFINIARGAALYKFNRPVHVKDGIKFDNNLPVWVNLDFNVAPFAATLWNRMPDKEHVKLRAFGEIKIEGGDTYEMADAIWSKVGSKYRSDDSPGIVIFPDPHGNQRRTSARDLVTDLDILETKGFTDIRYSFNSSVRGALNAANAFVGRNHIELDRKACKETIMDFEQCTMKPGTGQLDKKNMKRTHWLDGFKNMIDYEWPINVEAGGWQRTQVR